LVPKGVKLQPLVAALVG